MDFPDDWPLPPATFYPPLPQRSSHSGSTHSQRSSRITKSSVRHPSPRNVTRRKFNSLSLAPTRTRSVNDPLRRPTFSHWQAPYAVNRPTSWHTTFDTDTPSSLPELSLNSDSFSYMSTPFTTAEVNGVFTPLSMPILDEPQINEMVTPLDEYSGDIFSDTYWNFPVPPQTQYWPEGMKPVDAYTPIYDNMYDQFQHASIDTAPASPSFLPIQSNSTTITPDAPSGDRVHGEGEELVGMGLYDRPAEIRSSRLSDGLDTFTSGSPLGKGLKLEDSFDPPPVSDENEDDDDAPEDIADVDDEPLESTQSALVMAPQEYQSAAASSAGLAGQSFFFDKNEGYRASGPVPVPSHPVYSSTNYFNTPYFYGGGGYEWF